jgi:hypothetical protein
MGNEESNRIRENVPQYMYISVPYILVGVDDIMLGLG